MTPWETVCAVLCVGACVGAAMWVVETSKSEIMAAMATLLCMGGVFLMIYWAAQLPPRMLF